MGLTLEVVTDRLSCSVGNLTTNQHCVTSQKSEDLNQHIIVQQLVVKQYSHQSDAKMAIDTIVMTLIKQKSTKWQHHQTEKLSRIINL